MSAEARTAWVALGLLAAASPAAAVADRPPKTSTVTVDCGKGQSINAALQSAAEDLVVEIRGFCNEDVVVTRSQTTLRGADPSLDGIRGVATQPPDPIPPVSFFGGALTIRDADVVSVQNLTLSSGAAHGAAVHEANGAEFRNCVFTGNPDAGIHISSGSFVRVIDSTASGNGTTGARVQRGGTGQFTRCVLKDNPTPGSGNGLAALTNGIVFADSSEIGGRHGVIAQSGGRADVIVSSVTGTVFAVSAQEQSNALVVESTIAGPIRAANQAKVALFGATQTANVGANRAFAGGVIQANTGESGRSGIIGPTSASAFGQVQLFDANHVGDLSCDNGGDAVCSDPSAITGAVNGCAHCVP